MQGKFVLEKIVGWADGFIVCPRGLQSAWAQMRAHPTFVDFKHNFRQNKLALGTHAGLLLVRLREPGAHALMEAINAIAAEIADWAGCFVVLTENKIRIKRP